MSTEKTHEDPSAAAPADQGAATSAADRAAGDRGSGHHGSDGRPTIPPSPYVKGAADRSAGPPSQATATPGSPAHDGAESAGVASAGVASAGVTSAGVASAGVTPVPRRRVRDADGAGSSLVAAPRSEHMSDPDWDAPEDPPMIRRRELRPRMGWRALAYDLTRGLWNPGLSEKESRIRERERQIARQLRGKHVTAFFCLKGGISKTSTTAATSIAMANLRPDPVFAIDANPDAGDLAERLVGQSRAGITELSRHVAAIGSLDDLSRYSVTAGRLTMLPGEPNPALGDSLSAEDFRRIMGVVQRYYNVVQVDCGTGVTHPLMSGILEFADTVVIPASWSITGAKRAAETIQWLETHGFSRLARTCIVVLTAKDLVSRSVDKEAVRAHLAQAADLIVVPSDPHVADGALIDWEQLGPATREAYLDIAAAITRRFPEGGWPS